MRFFVFILLLLGVVAKAESPFLSDIEMIRSHSFAIQTEIERLDAANSNALSKKMFWTPTVTLSGGKQKSISNLPGSINTDGSFWGASANWNIFKGGGDLYANSAAKAQVHAQDLRIQDENLKQEFQAANIIFHKLYVDDVIASTKAQLELREEANRIVREKYKQGKTPLQEVEKSEIDRSSQETRLRNLEIESLEARAQWKALLIQNIQTSTWPFSSAQKIPQSSSSPTPETANLEKIADSQESLWKSVRSSYFPSLDFTAGYQESPVGRDAAYTWNTGLTLTFPLWSQFETAAKTASARADYVAAQNRYEDAKRAENARREVLDSRLELARLNLNDAKESREKSERLYRDVLKSFRYGRISMNELLVEQNRLIDSNLNLSQSQWDFHRILTEGCALSGLQIKDCIK